MTAMTISDTERREVAERLRKAIGLTEFAEVLGFNWTDDSDWVWNDVSNLVADLIEPSDHIGDSDKMVDRDALLALAEDVAYSAAMATAVDASKSAEMLAELLLDIARRIREACGEVVE